MTEILVWIFGIAFVIELTGLIVAWAFSKWGVYGSE